MKQLLFFFSRNKSNIVVYVLLLIALAGVCYWHLASSWKGSMADVDRQLFDAVRMFKYRVHESYFDRAVDADAISRKEYRDNGRIIKDVAARFNIKYIYSMVEIDGKFYFTSSDLSVDYFEPYEDDWPELRLVADDGVTRYDSSTDSFGKMRSCLCRFTTIHGQNYLIGADVPMDEIALMRWGRLKMFLPHENRLIVIDTIVFFGLALLSVWLVRKRQWYILLPSWLIFLFVLGMGNAYVAQEEKIQRDYWKRTLMDWCTTFADSTQKTGHDKILPLEAEPEKTPADTKSSENAAIEENNLPLEDRWKVWDRHVASSGRESYLKIMEMYQQWQKDVDIVMYVYTVRLVGPQQMEFICSPPTDADMNGIVENIKSEAGDPPFTPYDEGFDEQGRPVFYWAPAFEHAFKGITYVDHAMYSDIYGHSVTAATPLYDPNGNIEAVFAIDIDIEEWSKMADSVKNKSISLLCYASLFLLFVAGLVSVLLHFLKQSLDSNRLLQEQMQQTKNAVSATNAKSAFLANMSHEIRTPMNAILGFCTFLLRDQLRPQDREHVLGIKTASQTLLALINDVLDFSKIEAGKIEIFPTVYEIFSLVNDSVNIVIARATQKSLNFYVDVSPKLPSRLIGDEVRIRQVITNLMTNAIKFTDRGYVRLSIDGDLMDDGRLMLKIAVQDTGMGIKPESIDELFGAFQQVDTHKNRAIEGTGLGLAISKRFIELMDGDIQVVSEYGKGSTFSFKVPQVVAKDAQPVVAEGFSKEMQILVQETRPDDVQNWQRMFESLGIQGRIVSSVDCVLDAAKTDEYTHFFIDESTYVEHASELISCRDRIFVVLNLGENSSQASRIATIRRPIYSLTLVNKLLDVSSDEEVRDTKICQFTAPSVRILVVDDNNTNLTIASGLLSPYEVDVRCASSGKDAIEQVRSEYFDLVLMDHMMPEIDGVEATRTIRGIEGDYFKQLPIIAATANAIAGVRESYIREGFNDYIAKPIEPAQLDRILLQWIPVQKQIRRTEKPETDSARQLSGIQQPDSSPVSDLLDIRTGLLYAGGNEKSYGDVLRSFLQTSEKSVRVITRTAEEKSWKSFEMEVHAIKGLAKGIGAAKLSEASLKMEIAGKKRDENYVVGNIEQYLQLLKATLESIERILEIDPRFAAKEVIATSSETTMPLEQTLGEVVERLEEYDAAKAGELLNRLLQQPFDEKTLSDLEEIRSRIDQFNYEDSVDLIRKLISKG